MTDKNDSEIKPDSKNIDSTQDKKPDYEVIPENDGEINEGTIKTAKIFGSILKYFSLTIILFLIMSYISNNYIAGIGMNFIPMFLPIGKTFSCKPALATIFHPDKLPEDSNKFFKKMNLTSGGCKETYTYYELVEMGGNFLQILKGVTGLSALFNKGNITEIDLTQVFLIDYDKSCWYQKLVLVFFGAIQMLIGIASTLFSSLAYLFSGKHGFLLNMPHEKKILGDKKSFPFEDIGISMMKTKTDQATLKSGWTKFAMFFNFINFIFVDKLTYGTRYFIEDKHSSFMDRFKYFFLIIFILVIVGELRNAYSDKVSGITWGVILIIILFVFFAKRVLNPLHAPNPFPNYEGLMKEIQNSAAKNNSSNSDYTFNKMEKDITELKDVLDKAMKNYTAQTEITAKELKFEKIPNKPIKDQLKDEFNKAKENMKKGFDNLKDKFKKKPATENPEEAAKSAQANLAPAQAGGSNNLRVKPQYRKIISELRKELGKK